MQDFKNTIQDIIADNASGSSQILDKTISAILEYIQENSKINTKLLSSELLKLFEKHSNFAILFHFLNEFFLLMEVDSENQLLLDFLREYHTRWEKTGKRMAEHFLDHIEKDKIHAVLFHSNSSAIHAFCRKLTHHKKFPVIYQTLSGPANEGKLQASKPWMNNFEIRFIHENAAAKFIPDIDFAVFGADLISNEFFINKAGTYSLALLCREYKKPVFVLADSRKLIPQNLVTENIFSKLTTEIPKDPKELWDSPPVNVKPLNFYFEMIPTELITLFFGENGELTINRQINTMRLSKTFGEL